MNSEEPPKKKLGPCCVCKDTKAERDSCILQKSEPECQPQIERHKQCLKEHGFK